MMRVMNPMGMGMNPMAMGMGMGMNPMAMGMGMGLGFSNPYMMGMAGFPMMGGAFAKPNPYGKKWTNRLF